MHTVASSLPVSDSLHLLHRFAIDAFIIFFIGKFLGVIGKSFVIYYGVRI
ncbi:predicted protein [Arabidopsis lyrata subsp. lyrata]|uniref:Predicted protein n=1 Tax=Arabidopsis lyrata subsp. lyrata TaxID=81972 RepID=D7KC30_ARALL|nr:predicted protein [Arabidopsis lyrata subsp. lyrata]